MIHLIICGHGHFATGLLAGAELLCGKSPSCDAIDFSEGMSSEQLREKIAASLQSAGDVPVLFLTDIIGGTPFRECSSYVAALKDAEVISGANLQMLTEACLDRDEADNLQTFGRELIKSAQECMNLLSDKLASQAAAADDDSDDDGI